MSSTMTSYSSAIARASPSSPFATRSTPQRCSSNPLFTNCPTVGSSSITRIFIGRENGAKCRGADANRPPRQKLQRCIRRFNERWSTPGQLRPRSTLNRDLERRQAREGGVVVVSAAAAGVVDVRDNGPVKVTRTKLVNDVVGRVHGVIG